MTDFPKARLKMVEDQIVSRGIKDAKLIAAMKKIPRHLFVPENLRRAAYEDRPLPIGDGQTISQPYIVAWMTELLELKKGEKVLEVAERAQELGASELMVDVLTAGFAAVPAA
jgi:protein-L-isoaspartate(D-aspartate) O-methyltransferase